jgi:hypothetical protein
MAVSTARRAVPATVLALLAVAASLFVAAAPARAAGAAPARLCVPVLAEATGQDLGGGQTQGTLRIAGIAFATSHASFTTTSVDGAVAHFQGPIVLTPVVGRDTLTAVVTGSFDTSTGAFRATSSTVTGTGLLAGASGQLTFTGTENLTGAFTETVSGRLCD